MPPSACAISAPISAIYSDRSAIAEFDINQSAMEIAESLLAQNPKIIGLGIYIWNTDQSRTLAGLLKRLCPDIILILGGPEISYETDQQTITQSADFIITGEADLAFADLCRQLLAGRRPLMKIIPADLPEFSNLRLPYDLYDADDVAHRVVSMSKPPADAPSNASFVYRAWTSPCVMCHWMYSSARCRSCLIAAFANSNLSIAPFNLNLNIGPLRSCKFLFGQPLHARTLPPFRNDPRPPPRSLARMDRQIPSRRSAIRDWHPNLQ